MLAERIETLLVGNATGMVNSFKEGGTAADALGTKTTTTGRLMDQLGLKGLSTGDMIGKGLQVGSALGTVAVAKMAFDGVQQFANQTAAVRGFQRVLGGTAEDASRLSAATGRMGIDAGTAQSAFGQLAKRIGEGKDTLAQWGVQIDHNKDGSVNFSKTLENISDKYASIEDPAKRAAFASENFGKGYQSINALLGQGKTNLEQFYAVADQHHQIFSQDDLDKGLQYSRSIKDLDTAFQGVEVELGRGLIPLLTGAAHIFEGVFDVLDKVSGAAGGFNVNAVAMGALIGTAINPGLGTLIGAGAGAATSLISMVGATASLNPELDKMSKGLTAVNASKAAQSFLDMKRAIGAAPDWLEAPKSASELFKKLADESPANAAKIIQGLQAQGVSTAEYQRILDSVVQKKHDEATATDRSKQANQELTGTIDQQIAALDAQANALLAGYDKQFAATSATLSAKQAIDDLTLTTYLGGASQADLAGKLNTAAESSVHAAAAIGANTEEQHKGEGAVAAHSANIQAQIGYLQSLAATLSPDDPLRQFLQGYIDKLNDPAMNSTHTAGADVDTGPAHAKLDVLEQRLIALNGRQITIGINAVGNALDRGLAGWLQT